MSQENNSKGTPGTGTIGRSGGESAASRRCRDCRPGRKCDRCREWRRIGAVRYRGAHRECWRCLSVHAASDRYCALAAEFEGES